MMRRWVLAWRICFVILRRTIHRVLITAGSLLYFVSGLLDSARPESGVDIDDYYIDLVFYNYMLKCFFLIDLKTHQITHQDVGQMDMYVRMYDQMKRSEGDNPTIGIIPNYNLSPFGVVT